MNKFEEEESPPKEPLLLSAVSTQLSAVNVYSSALEMARAIRYGSITSRQLVDLHIARIEALDYRINAIVLRDFESARSQADQADQVVRDCKDVKRLGRFHGVPITMKESIFTPGYRSTMGDPKFWVPSGADCNTAKIMIEEGGAILLGKSNLCYQLLDWECNNPVYGATCNPYNISLSPGGSSGGAAAALAAGFTPMEIGTDLGGSIRIPAAMCGVIGHCATRGIIPNPNPMYSWPCISGCINRSLAKMLDNFLWMARAGPLARTVEDVVAMVELLGGDKVEDLQRPKTTIANDGSSLDSARIAIWRTNEICPPGMAVNIALDKAVAALKSAGAIVEELRPPIDPFESYSIYLRFCGPIAEPHISDQQRLNAKNGRAKESYPPEMRSPFWEMDTASVFGVPEENMVSYENVLTQWEKYLGNYDAVLSPAFPTEAWPTASNPDSTLVNVKTGAREFIVDGEHRCYGDAIFWSHLSVLCGFPSTSFPVCTTTNKDLPVGLQAFGCRGSDFIILDIVRNLMRELKTNHFTPPAGFEAY